MVEVFALVQVNYNDNSLPGVTGLMEFILLLIIGGIFYYFKYYRKKEKEPNNDQPIQTTQRLGYEYVPVKSDQQPSYVPISSVTYEDSHRKFYPLIRKHAKPELDRFLNDERDTRIIIFDLETNGLYAECSVLSCSAIKYDRNPNTYEMTEIDHFNRYYYPVEEFNPQAIEINGLTRDVITEKRGDGTYPEHFCMDSDFEIFCSDTERFVAHNISFDMQFVPFLRNKNKMCTMMTNMNIVAAEYLDWKNEWKWPKLSETANYYCIPFNESDLHDSMYDAKITAKVFLKMLEATKIDDRGTAVEIDDSLPDFDSNYNSTWELKNINEELASQCKVGEALNLSRACKIDNVNYMGVTTKSGAHLGDIDVPDINYYNLCNLCFNIDHGAKVSAKIKQIFTKSEKLERIYIKVSIGNVDREEQNKLFPIDREAKRIITRAKTLEKTNPAEAVSLYRKAIDILKGIDQQCEKHFSTWREQKFPINRLSLILEKHRRYQECLDEIETYEKVVDKVGLYTGEKEIIGKRKVRMLKAIKKYSQNSKMLEAAIRDYKEIKSTQDGVTVNEYQEVSDFQRFLNTESGFTFSAYGPQGDTYLGMSVNLWIPKVKNPEEVYIYPRNANCSFGMVPYPYSDRIINHLLDGMSYDARIVERDYNTCKIKCRLISKEENELRKEEYKTFLIKEFKKPYTPKKPIILMVAAKKKKSVKVRDKLVIEFVDLDSFGLYPKLYLPWHIKFLNQTGDTVGIFDKDRNTIQKVLKAHFNSYLFDIEVLEIAKERSLVDKGYPTKLIIKSFKS